MWKVCSKWQIRWNKSPLCWNTWLFLRLEDIAIKHWLSFGTMLAITFAESHVWANYVGKCWWTNNRSGIKAKKNDDWTMVKYKLPYSWCRLYPFNSPEEYRESFANTLSIWYMNKGCDTVECVSTRYVGTPWPIKYSWVNNVKSFLK